MAATDFTAGVVAMYSAILWRPLPHIPGLLRMVSHAAGILTTRSSSVFTGASQMRLVG